MTSPAPVLVLAAAIGLVGSGSAPAAPPIYVFNSDGGAAAIAHIKGKVTREVVCHELNELEATGVTDFFWCPIVGGNVFIYPTRVGERMGDNIRDWEKVHPYYREQGRAMASNLRQLIERGEDPIKMLAVRARELGVRFWLTCRMNEIHEDDDRFMVVRSLFKEKHPELVHGKNFHPEAVYAPIKGWSYAWDYSKQRVRDHFLALFDEWLEYEIDGIELDFVRSPCLFPPGKEREGQPLLTDFVTRLRGAVNRAAGRRRHKVRLAVRVPPSLELCRKAGIDIRTWIDQGLVDQVTPMDRGYFDPEPQLAEFLPLGKRKGVAILGGIEPKVRGYSQSSRQTFAVANSFLHQGADGIYLFNYDCHRKLASSSKFGGVLQDYTPGEKNFLRHALDAAVRRDHDKQYLVSHDSAGRSVENGGTRPLPCLLPVGKSKIFRMTVGDDLEGARKWKRIAASRLVVTLDDCNAGMGELVLKINGRVHGVDRFRWEPRKPTGRIVVTVTDPPMHRGSNSIEIGVKAGDDRKGRISSIDFNIAYRSPDSARRTVAPPARRSLPVLGRQQLFAYIPQSLEIFIKEPRHVREPSDWPANMLRFQFPESVNAFGKNNRRLWEFSFETSRHDWRVVSKAGEKTMGGAFKNRVMRCEDVVAGKAVIRRTATWTDKQLDFRLMIRNLGKQPLSHVQTSMCLQRTAAPDYYDHGNTRTFVVSDQGFVASRELVFHPKKLMFYGNVGDPLDVIDKSSPRTLQESCLLVVSADKRYVLCYAWRGATMVFMNRSGRCRCLHSEFRLTDVAPGQSVEIEGVLFVHEGSLEQAHKRFLAWKTPAQQKKR